MLIRPYTPYDYPEVRRLYNNFVKEFAITDVLDPHTLELFVVEDNEGNLVCAGGIRTILEMTMVTDINALLMTRQEAQFKILAACNFIAKQNDYDQIHAFIQDEKWLKILQKPQVGFKETKGKSLVLCL